MNSLQSDVRARDLMRTQVVSLTPEVPIRKAVESLQEDGLGGLPVLDAGERVIGFLSSAA